MASNKINVALAYDTPWEYEGTQGSDKATATLKYKDDFSGWATRCPAYGTAHPDLTGFTLARIKASREPGDQIAVTLIFEANDFATDLPGRPGGEAANPRYSVRVSGREEPLLTIPKIGDDLLSGLAEIEIKALNAIANGQETDESGAQWETQITSDPGLYLLQRIRKGNTAYKTGGVVFVERRLIKTLTDLRYASLYKIDTPPGPYADICNVENAWLYLGGDIEPAPDGASWFAEFQWELNPDGWEVPIYGIPTP